MITQYVLGFAFHDDCVVLIEKRRGPAPVLGKLNGIGGRYESTDASPAEAMSREFREETGIITQPAEWQKFADFRIHKYRAAIHCFKLYLKTAPSLIQMTDERVSWYLVRDVPYLNIVPNLKWLVPLAHDFDLLLADIADTTT